MLLLLDGQFLGKIPAFSLRTSMWNIRVFIFESWIFLAFLFCPVNKMKERTRENLISCIGILVPSDNLGFVDFS